MDGVTYVRTAVPQGCGADPGPRPSVRILVLALANILDLAVEFNVASRGRFGYCAVSCQHAVIVIQFYVLRPVTRYYGFCFVGTGGGSGCEVFSVSR